VLDTVPQGSWAHKTIIRPPLGKEFDAEFLVQLAEDASWNADPQKYSDAIWEALVNHGIYKIMTTQKNRCVRVRYANFCHVDIVPYVVRSDGYEVIVNRTTNNFETTNPIGFTSWLQEKDDLTSGNLRKVIRLLKHLRDRQGAFVIKSICSPPSLATSSTPGEPSTPTTTRTCPPLWSTSWRTWTSGCKPDHTSRRSPIPAVPPRRSTIAGPTSNTRPSVTASINSPPTSGLPTPRRESAPASPRGTVSSATPSRNPSPALLSARRASSARSLHELEGRRRRSSSRTRWRSTSPTVSPLPARSPSRPRSTGPPAGRFAAAPTASLNTASCSSRSLTAMCHRPSKSSGRPATTARKQSVSGSYAVRSTPTRVTTNARKSTLYAGRHWMECYIVKDGVCVARAHEPVLIA
jgi:hypothetical protein